MSESLRRTIGRHRRCATTSVMRDRDGWTATFDPDTALVTWTSPDHTTTIHTTPRRWRRPPPTLTPDRPDP